MAVNFKAGKCPVEALSKLNRVVLHPGDHESLGKVKHVAVAISQSSTLVFTIEPNDAMPNGQVGFTAIHRKWGGIDVNQDILVQPYNSKDFIISMKVEIDFFNKKKVTQNPYNTDDMAKEFFMQFPSQVFSVGQPLVFQFKDMPLTLVTVQELEVANVNAIGGGQAGAGGRSAKIGLSLPNSAMIFEKAEGSAIFLSGKSKGRLQQQSIINPDWDFSKMGIGGLDDQFNAIFRRAFASRVFPPEIMEQLGCKHVKGILLFGPPGTGKTLMARQVNLSDWLSSFVPFWLSKFIP